MFDFVRKHTRLFQFILLLLILPSFVFFGVQGYSSFMDGSNAGVASVDGHKITQAEWDASHRDQVERMRRQMPNVDAKLFDAPEVRRESLEGLVRERVMQTAAVKQQLVVSDERLLSLFKADPQFAFLRTPEGRINKAIIEAQGMSVPMFEQRLRQDLTLRQVLAGVGGSGIGGVAPTAVAFDALLQQREVQLQRFDAKEFLARVSPSDAEIEAYYRDPAHAAAFQLPETAQIEYVVLDLDQLKKGVAVSDEDLRKYYSENLSRYTVAEERRASHILIKADKTSSTADRAKARARADELLVQARKNPAGFADLARKNSQDEGSAPNGGDLDYFGHGAMVKPFEDAAFALKQGEISNVIESDFGYHVIMLTGVRGGEKKSFESVRAQIEDEVRKQLAQRRYAEAAEQFTNTVYEQSDSLSPVADKLKLNVQTATVQRTPAPNVTGVLASAKLIDAVFGNDALRNKRNTEAVETAPSQMAAARVVQYNPARLEAFAEVKPHARELLVKQLAAAQAVKAGEARIAALRKSGDDVAGLESAQLVSRALARGLPRKVLDGILSADASKLPVALGIDAGDGVYVVARIGKVVPRDPTVVDPARAELQYAQAWSGAETEAYYSALKTHYKAVIKAKVAATPAP